jgi:hypothetical protein
MPIPLEAEQLPLQAPPITSPNAIIIKSGLDVSSIPLRKLYHTKSFISIKYIYFISCIHLRYIKFNNTSIRSISAIFALATQ